MQLFTTLKCSEHLRFQCTRSVRMLLQGKERGGNATKRHRRKFSPLVALVRLGERYFNQALMWSEICFFLHYVRFYRKRKRKRDFFCFLPRPAGWFPFLYLQPPRVVPREDSTLFVTAQFGVNKWLGATNETLMCESVEMHTCGRCCFDCWFNWKFESRRRWLVTKFIHSSKAF